MASSSSKSVDDAVADGQPFIHKFPRTQHLFDLGSTTSDDIKMSDKEAKAFIQAISRNGWTALLEEKIDGANIGLSLSADQQILIQNRGHYVNSETSAQFKSIDAWVASKPQLWELLAKDIIVFGEWMYAKHSIHYTALPDYFIAFDVYDRKTREFYTRDARNALLAEYDIPVVPLLYSGPISKDIIVNLLRQRSAYAEQPIEGVYIRVESASKLEARAKVVRTDFIQDQSRHWTKGAQVKNIISYDH